jgi:PAS domain S-box-containing protein
LIGEVFVNALTRKLGEDRQRESEGRFRIVADSAPVMIWMSGVDKLCTFFNKTWLDFTGRSLEQELGNGWTEGVHRADLERCLQSYVEAFNARRPFVLHYRLRRHDGEYRWISDNGIPRYDAHGEFAGYIGSCADFTERKQAEEKFRLAVETSPNAILLVDQRGRIVMANPQTEAMFGYAAEELAGQSMEMLVPERFRGRHSSYRQEFHASPQTRAMGKGRELFARRKDGSEIEVEIALNPIHAQDEMLVLATIVDVTERRRANMEMQTLRQELAHSSRVSVMGQLASALAHELNQPLGAILRNAEAAELFLQKKVPDLDEVRAILADIRKDDHRAGEVIDRMRGLLSRRKLERTQISVLELVDEVLGLIRPDAQHRKVHLSREVPGNLAPVLVDRVHLQQVLLNLLLNGMDAMSETLEEERQLVVSAQQDDGQSIEVCVRDTGPGIPESRLPSLFEPFYTTKPQGLGIGLPISRTIIEAHGGKLWAENHPKRGAMFRFTLPVGNNGNQ